MKFTQFTDSDAVYSAAWCSPRDGFFRFPLYYSSLRDTLSLPLRTDKQCDCSTLFTRCISLTITTKSRSVAGETTYRVTGLSIDWERKVPCKCHSGGCFNSINAMKLFLEMLFVWEWEWERQTYKVTHTRDEEEASDTSPSDLTCLHLLVHLYGYTLLYQSLASGGLCSDDMRSSASHHSVCEWL